MSDERIRVGVVMADPLRALGLESILEETVGVAAVVLDLETAALDRNLVALLLDRRSCGEALTETIAKLRRDWPERKIVIVGESFDMDIMQAAIAAGAKGYLQEGAPESEVRMAMEVVLDGSVWAPRKVLAKVIDAGGVAHGTRPADTITEKMTPREKDVLRLLQDAKSNREIANAMGVDEVTVKAHLGRMLRKSGSNNRVELTLRAMEERRVPQENGPSAVI